MTETSKQASVADATSVLELTSDNFAKSIDDHPFAFVDFWAPWCAPCRAFAPTFAAAAARNPDVLFAKVNTEDQQAIGAQFNIRSIPTLMIFRSNIVVYAEAGALQARAPEEWLGAARAHDTEHARRWVAAQPLRVPRSGTPREPVPDRNQAAADASLLSIETY